MKNKIIYTIVSAMFPVITLAQPLGGVRGMLTTIGSFINQLILITFGLALLYFFWGIGQFILNAGDPKKIADGKNRIIWGVIAMFVMLSIYGIIYFIGGIFGFGPGGSINIMTGVVTPGQQRSGGTTIGDDAWCTYSEENQRICDGL